MANTHVNTPFGKLFQKLGIWHPDVEDTIKDVYDKLSEDIQVAVKTSSGFLAIISTNLDKTPDEVFAIIQKKYPHVTKEGVNGFFTHIIKEMRIVSEQLPKTFEESVSVLQLYLNGLQHKTWIAIIKAAVTIGTDFLNPNITMIQKVELVLEYVYQTFIKGKATLTLPDPIGNKY